jgi:hypothetical protein
LHRRFSVHKNDYKRYLSGKSTSYVSSIEVVQHDDAKIELIQEGMFDTKKDLEKLEGHYIEATPNTVNKKGAGLTRAESSQKYYIKHKEAYLAHQNEKLVCDVCCAKFSRANYSRHCRTKKHQAAMQELGAVEFISTSTTRTPEELCSEEEEISDESFYYSAAASS